MTMNEYICIFWWFVLAVDLALMVVLLWCVTVNYRKIFYHYLVIDDIDFRVLLLMMCSLYSGANFEAFRRHVKTFLIDKTYSLNVDVVESLLTDRGLMLATSVFMYLLTIKYKSSWSR